MWLRFKINGIKGIICRRNVNLKVNKKKYDEILEIKDARKK